VVAMAEMDDILKGIEDIKIQQVRDAERMIALSNRLYDRDGDIPEIKERLTIGDGVLHAHGVKIAKLETTNKVGNRYLNGKKGKLATGGGGAAIVGGIIFGIGKGLGWW